MPKIESMKSGDQPYVLPSYVKGNENKNLRCFEDSPRNNLIGVNDGGGVSSLILSLNSECWQSGGRSLKIPWHVFQDLSFCQYPHDRRCACLSVQENFGISSAHFILIGLKKGWRTSPSLQGTSKRRRRNLQEERVGRAIFWGGSHARENGWRFYRKKSSVLGSSDESQGFAKAIVHRKPTCCRRVEEARRDEINTEIEYMRVKSGECDSRSTIHAFGKNRMRIK